MNKRVIKKIEWKIENEIPLLNSEIAYYMNIEEKLVRNVFIIYDIYGRESVRSITLTDNYIDKIIRFKYPKENVLGNNI